MSSERDHSRSFDISIEAQISSEFVQKGASLRPIGAKTPVRIGGLDESDISFAHNHEHIERSTVVMRASHVHFDGSSPLKIEEDTDHSDGFGASSAASHMAFATVDETTWTSSDAVGAVSMSSAIPIGSTVGQPDAQSFQDQFTLNDTSALHGFSESAPPSSGTVGGQLWYGLEDISKSGLDHVDSDDGGYAVSDVPTTGGGSNVDIGSVGLDGANGLYFFYGHDGLLRDGHIENDVETGSSSEFSSVNMVFGTGFNADVVNALAVDPINHIIFVGHWGQTDALTGIYEVQYNPTTGALTSPFNATSDTITDPSHVLFHDDNSGKVNGITTFTDAASMQYDMQNGNLYYVDMSGTWAGSTTSGSAWTAQNGIYVVSTMTANPTPTLLTLPSQFSATLNNHDGTTNNAYIIGLAINEAQGLIYFAVNNAHSTPLSTTFWYMPITGGTATQMTAPVGFGFADADNFGAVNPLAFDANLRQLYISDQTSHAIAQFTLSADGHSFTSGTDTFQTTNPGNDGGIGTSLYYDPTPTLSTLSATTTEAVQGGGAITLLASIPTISDPQDGATNKLHMGYAQMVISNAQAGDQLFLAGQQNGTVDSGKITVSWNAATHTLTLSGNETEAEYASLMSQVSFQDTGTDNSVGSHPARNIDFIISDGTTITDQTTADSNEQAVTVVIDRAPMLTADSYAVVESATSSGTSGAAGTGVLGNDNDKDGDAIVVTAVQGSGGNVGLQIAGTYGHLTLNADGSYSYLANITSAIDAAATGSHPVDTFTYTVSDGLGGVTTSTVSFTIDRAPTVVADVPSSQALESGSAVTGNVLTNDSDKDGDTLTVMAVNGSGANIGNSVAGTYGHITINADGSYTYTADNTAAIDSAATGSHLTDSFAYTANDGHGGTTATTITVTLDRAPTVVADAPSSQAVESGSAVTGNVLTNDSDRDGDTLVVSAVAGSGGNVGASIATTYGHITINSDGSYSYTADNTTAVDAAATGSHLSDTISYTASDGHGGTTTTNIVVTLDRAPAVVADAPSSQAIESGSVVTGNVLSNDSDRDGDTLVVSAVAGSGGNVGTSIATTYGHITINADGSYSYTADNAAAIDFAATGSHLTDTVSYTASDGHGGTTTTNIVITLDRAPTVVSDAPASQALESGSAVTGNVLSNDSDRDGDTLTVTAVNGSGGNVGNSLAGTYGHLTVNADGSYSYAADIVAAIDAAATGSHLTETFTYTADDGHGGTSAETITVTIDRGPDTTGDAANALESGSAAVGNVLSNDSDRDSDTLTVSAVAGSAGNVGTSTATTYGHITINADGSYSYTADNTAAIDSAATGSHLTDTVTYVADDGHGGTSTQTITVTLDRGPTAIDDTGSGLVTEGGSTSQNSANGVLFNDSDRDGDSLTVTAVGGSGANVGTSFATTYGHITLNADGSYSYIADNTSAIEAAATGSHPTDVISITVSDGHGGAATETLSLTIDRPTVGNADTFATTESSVGVNGGTNANLLANDSDPDGDSFAIIAVNGSSANIGNQFTLASGALLTVNADGSYAYDPNHVFDDLPGASSGASNTTATDTFTYTLTGGEVITVTVTINGQDSNDILQGTAGNDTLHGGVGDDQIHALGGADQVFGDSGNDYIDMASFLTAADHVDGGTGFDKLYLNGDYSAGVVFSSTTVTNVELINLAASFSYNLTTNDATVAAGQSLTIQAGSLGAGDAVIFNGGAETDGSFIFNTGAGNDVLTGGALADRFYSGTGNDTIHGGGGNDTISMGATLTAADVIDGGTGSDTVVLNGNYSGGSSVVFGAATLTNVEELQLNAGFNYNLTTNDATVANGQTLTVKADGLGAADMLTFNGTAETNGSFIVNSGAGDDLLIGGAGNDTFRPG